MKTVEDELYKNVDGNRMGFFFSLFVIQDEAHSSTVSLINPPGLM